MFTNVYTSSTNNNPNRSENDNSSNTDKESVSDAFISETVSEVFVADVDVSALSAESDLDDANIDFFSNRLSIFTLMQTTLEQKNELEVILRKKIPETINNYYRSVSKNL